MSINEDRIKYLLRQYANQVATEDEVNELFRIVRVSENDVFLKGWLAETLDTEEPAEIYDQARWDKVVGKILIPAPSTQVETGADPVSLEKESDEGLVVDGRRRFGWTKWVVAASVLLIVGLGSYFLFFNKTGEKNEVVVSESNRFKNDVDPGTDGAILKLANGERIVLDTAADGSLVMQSNTQVRKIKGMVVYQPENSASAKQEVVYNTLETPKGRKYRLTLPDGTEVWLDAASSITFPSMFIGEDRKVSITGQVYFEVRQDKEHPFKVDAAGKGEIEVLGTHFNINAYSDEPVVRTTLLEGSVKVKVASAAPRNDVIIKPGEQAVTMNNGQLAISKNVDLEEVMAWKDGRFYFKSADLETILRQAMRWYDVDIEYKRKINTRFNGEVNRDVKLSDLLKAMELSGGVEFGIEGKKIIVK